MASTPTQKEGNLEAPTRHAIDWKNPSFYDEENLFKEMERVFDLCHGCRRCVSLCRSFPTLFDLIDESKTMEVDGVDKKDYWKVVDHCYLCDLCYMTKCPYVPPHPWNLDFPHLMLRAKAVKFKNGEVKIRDKILTSTDQVGKLASLPGVSAIVNFTNRLPVTRKLLAATLGVHAQAPLPEYHSNRARSRLSSRINKPATGTAAGKTKGRVLLFTTCYGQYNEPQIVEDLVAVLEHNGIGVTLAEQEQCCGMPKLELGDLQAVEKAKDANIPQLEKWVNQGFDLLAPVPSCALMFRSEMPLIFPEDAAVQIVAKATFDIFEYLMLRYKEGLLKTDFKQSLGKVVYHAACHQRVQNVGAKTRDLLALVPDTQVQMIERCSGHDGTYAVKVEFHEDAMKIGRPIMTKIQQDKPDHYGSDCPIAGHHIAHGVADGTQSQHPISLIRKAYAI